MEVSNLKIFALHDKLHVIRIDIANNDIDWTDLQSKTLPVMLF